MKIILVAGTRPNFMKIAPLLKVLEYEENKDIFETILVHTGQHYDKNMSEVFFKELNIRKPDYYLGVGSRSHAEITGKIMIEFEKVLLKEKPDLVIVVGDVDSTMAATITAKKLHIKVAHVEAGLRSFNREMPEELNRIVTDHLSDLLFVTQEEGVKNIHNEGIKENVFLVGNVMIDTLYNLIDRLDFNLLKKYNLEQKNYVLWTMHRAETVDNKILLEKAINILKDVQSKIKVIWPMHPRVKKRLKEFSLNVDFPNVIITEPLGYLELINLEKNALIVMTDSGGIQEETSALNISCLTLRKETERPITVTKGTNIVVWLDKNKILHNLDLAVDEKYPKKESKIPLWDGKASERIVEILKKVKK